VGAILYMKNDLKINLLEKRIKKLEETMDLRFKKKELSEIGFGTKWFEWYRFKGKINE
jgi:translation elongation factor EF-1beta